jgi:hypothetical protein
MQKKKNCMLPRSLSNLLILLVPAKVLISASLANPFIIPQSWLDETAAPPPLGCSKYTQTSDVVSAAAIPPGLYLYSVGNF